jgi:hypothetical protein
MADAISRRTSARSMLTSWWRSSAASCRPRAVLAPMSIEKTSAAVASTLAPRSRAPDAVARDPHLDRCVLVVQLQRGEGVVAGQAALDQLSHRIGLGADARQIGRPQRDGAAADLEAGQLAQLECLLLEDQLGAQLRLLADRHGVFGELEIAGRTAALAHDLLGLLVQLAHRHQRGALDLERQRRVGQLPVAAHDVAGELAGGHLGAQLGGRGADARLLAVGARDRAAEAAQQRVVEDQPAGGLADLGAGLLRLGAAHGQVLDQAGLLRARRVCLEPELAAGGQVADERGPAADALLLGHLHRLARDAVPGHPRAVDGQLELPVVASAHRPLLGPRDAGAGPRARQTGRAQHGDVDQLLDPDPLDRLGLRRGLLRLRLAAARLPPGAPAVGGERLCGQADRDHDKDRRAPPRVADAAQWHGSHSAPLSPMSRPPPISSM